VAPSNPRRAICNEPFLPGGVRCDRTHGHDGLHSWAWELADSTESTPRRRFIVYIVHIQRLLRKIQSIADPASTMHQDAVDMMNVTQVMLDTAGQMPPMPDTVTVPIIIEHQIKSAAGDGMTPAHNAVITDISSGPDGTGEP